MNGDGHDFGAKQFFYHHPTLGTVVNLYPIDPNDRRIYVDVVPHDNRGFVQKAPVFTVPGVARQMRLGQSVLIFYIDSNPQLPVIFGHNFNIELPTTLYHNPMHPEHYQIDDFVASHEETAVFSRKRSRWSTATTSGPAGSPAVYDTVFNSGVALQVYEYDPTGYVRPPKTQAQPPSPPPPDRARVTLTMPSQLAIVIDEPAPGKNTIAITHPTGATLTIATDGTVTVHSPKSVTTDAAGAVTPETPAVAVAALVPGGPTAPAAAPGYPNLIPKVYTLHDGNGNVISHVAGSVGLGALYSELSSAEEAFNATHMQNQIAQIRQHVGAALQQAAQAAILAEVPNSGAWLTAIQGGLPTLDFVDLLSSMAPLPLVSGSSVVRLVT